MCCNEVWSYRDCGCYYNYTIQCIASRYRERLQSSAQNQDGSWSPGVIGSDTIANVNTDELSDIFSGAQDCPYHETVQKSFLNQICDECLLAELRTEGRLAEGSIERQDWSDAPCEDPLIWDSQVEVFIEQPHVEALSPALPTHPLESDAVFEHQTKDILESHVEITIEEPPRSGSREHSSPKTSTTCFGSNSSRTSQKLPQSLLTENPDPTKRYCCTFRSDTPIEASEADTDMRARASPSPTLFLCAPSVRSTHIENQGPPAAEVDSQPPPIRGRPPRRPLSRLHNLGSLSTTFLSSTKLSEPVPVGPKTSVSESFPKASRRFHTTRTRKSILFSGQHNHGQTMLATQHIEDSCSKILSAIPARPQIPTRKSNLLDFGISVVQSFKARNASSKTHILSKDAGREHGPMKSEQQATNTDTRVEPSEYDNEHVIPPIPKSSTMKTLRAVINDLNFGLEISAGGH
jgi:hypothetical protein